MNRIFLTLWMVTSLQFTLIAQPTDTLRSIDQLFSSWNNATPGGAILLARGDKIIYEKAFGLADLEHAVPNTTSTVFESGSVAKQFTAMAILLLGNEGKLNLQDDVRKFIPELPVYQKPITIQQLLNHTSGLKDWGTIGTLAGWPRTNRVYTQDLALRIICKQLSTNFTPGTEYSYSNTNYTLLVTLVERVSGISLEKFTRTRLFEPLGMVHTEWRSNFRKIIPDRAIAYAVSSDGYEQQMPFENIYGHGGLLTTTRDLLKWNTLLANPVVGGQAVYQERIRKGVLANGKEISYAAGLFIEKANGLESIQHSGATAGYRAWLAYYPAKKLSVIILSNDGGFSAATVGPRIASIFIGKPPEASSLNPVIANPADLKKFEGTYRSIRHFDAITLRLTDDKIRVTNHNTEKPTDAIQLGADALSVNQVTWKYLRSGHIQSNTFGDTLSFVKVSPPDTQPARLKSLEGKYFSSEAESEFSIEVKGTEVWAHSPMAKPVILHPSFRDGFYSDEGQLVEFLRNKQGAATGMSISQSRAEKVPFTKINQHP